MKEPRWIIVSNRLPFGVNRKTGRWETSDGGLITAISGIKSKEEKIWIGIGPSEMTAQEWKQINNHSSIEYIPLSVNSDLYSRYYDGMSNDVIWPLFHYEGSLAQFTRKNWEAYCEVNALLAKAVLKVARPNDLIWIHDYHLFCLPALLKKKNKNLKVGFFLHIPFPSYEIFRQLPVRKEILDNLLEADLIGFHDYSYLTHFCNSALNILGLESSLLQVRKGTHTVNLGVFPVSIDTQKIEREVQSQKVRNLIQKYKKSVRRKKLILGVDRLDYSKGIHLKLLAFREMFRQRPHLKGQVSLLQVAIPTRIYVPQYKVLRREIEQLVGSINGEFGKPDYSPIHYIYSQIPFDELLALYRLSDALLVTSRRDGMNLVSLEYVAAQNHEDPGLVLVSEFTGATSILSQAVIINPWNIEETAERISYALDVSLEERVKRHKPMVEFIENYTATHWAESFMKSLSQIPSQPKEETPKILLHPRETNLGFPPELALALRKNKILVILDYDGTLVPIHSHPMEASLPDPTHRALRHLLKNKKFQIIVVSGRDSDFLKKQLHGLDISFASEHGAYFFERNNLRHCLVHTNKKSWYPMALKIIKDYTSKVPGSFYEKKDFAIAWHYRNSPQEFAGFQAKKLREELDIGLANLPVTTLSGNKVIEVRAIEANKGIFARWFLETHHECRDSLIVALGDDATDENLFESLQTAAITVKVGASSFSKARYQLTSQTHVLPFLQKISSMNLKST